MKPIKLKEINAKLTIFFSLPLALCLLYFVSAGNEQLVGANNPNCAHLEPQPRYNNTLPATHPRNLCTEQATDLSWSNWLTGQSRTNHLHFMELFELLYGHKQMPMDDSSPSNQPHN